jgi:serine/threonine-protein kinase
MNKMTDQNNNGKIITDKDFEQAGYKLIQELGKSPRGTTYKGRRTVEQDIVAVKVFRNSACDKRFLDRLAKNAEATFFLEHANLVRSLGCSAVNGRFMLIMSFAPGQPLARILKKNGRVPATQALIVTLQVVTALRWAATQKRFHGRLHPADIILGEDHARVLGVGLGERPELPPWEQSKSPYLFEPLIYTAPEAMPSKGALETPEAQMFADVYSLGAILFHSLTGQPPFRGTDEDALNAERSKLGMPVAWPRQLASALPREVITLTERMLAANPAQRPNYDQLVPALTVAIPAAEQVEATMKQNASVTVVSPIIVAPAAPVVVEKSSIQEVASYRGASSSVSILDYPTAKAGAAEPSKNLQQMRAEKFFTAVLVGITAIAFLLAAGLTVEKFVYEPSRAAYVVKSEQPAAPVTAPAPVAQTETPAPVSVPAPVTPPPPVVDDYAAATQQLDVIDDMLKSGQLTYTPALLKVVRGIIDRAGESTPAGTRAKILCADIEIALTKKFDSSPHINPSAIPTEKVAEKAPESSAQAPAAPAAPATPPVPPAPAKPAEPAVASTQPPASTPPADNARQRQVYEGVQAAMGKVKTFQYADAKKDLELLLGGADGDAKKTVQATLTMLQLESNLFDRCRAKLKDEIAKDPQHESPLEVRPKRTETKSESIIDFDPTGLKMQPKHGNAASIHIKEWSKVPPKESLSLFKYLAGEGNAGADDQLMLAAYAFNHGLKEEGNQRIDKARNMPAGKEKADALSQQAELVLKVVEAGN